MLAEVGRFSAVLRESATAEVLILLGLGLGVSSAEVVLGSDVEVSVPAG